MPEITKIHRSVTTKQIAFALAARYPAFLTKDSAYALTKQMTTIIADALIDDQSVELEGVGRLVPRVGLARKGYSPSLNQAITIPARKRVRFSVYPALDKGLNPWVPPVGGIIPTPAP